MKKQYSGKVTHCGITNVLIIIILVLLLPQNVKLGHYDLLHLLHKFL